MNGFRSISRARGGGFTIVEIMIVLAIIGILAALAIPLYTRYLQRTRLVRTVHDLRIIEEEISMHSLRSGGIPETLADIGRQDDVDSWGGSFVYLRYQDNPQSLYRKERFWVPLNAEYDLYSKGPDGQSEAELSAPVSLDDVVRANDGGFIGLAAEF